MPKQKKEKVPTKTLVSGLDNYQSYMFLGVRKNKAGVETLVAGTVKDLMGVIILAVRESPELGGVIRHAMLHHSMEEITKMVGTAKEYLSKEGVKPESKKPKKSKSKK